MWNKSFATLMLCLCAFAGALSAQAVLSKSNKGEFTGLLRGGICTSQVNGDGYGGYNKLNGAFGVGVFTPISDKLRFQMELAYAGRGSRTKPKLPYEKIETHYIDIPLLLKFDVWKLEMEAGICNGILLLQNNYDINGKLPVYTYLPRFNRYELAMNIGVSKPLSPKWAINARFHYSLLPAAGGFRLVGYNIIVGGANNNTITLNLVRVLHAQDGTSRR